MEKKLALVTGASEGIGNAFAKRLAKDGYQVVSVARNEARLQVLVQEMGGAPHRYIVADLSTPEGVAKISTELTQTHYHLLVNNAGSGVYGRFDETPLSKLQEMTRLNCDALVALSHAYLKNSKSGDALVNVASTLAFLPMPITGLYSATKAFVTSFSESLWYEQKKRNVYVMDLCPGMTRTEFQKRAGVDTGRMPASLIQSPEIVVEAAMKALKKRKNPTIISGAKNFMMTTVARVMPRRATVKMMGNLRPE